ncbi:MAG: class I SAM-dependent methyltransferase [Candidatus Neomarinimicrobiota bacterium]
MFAVNECPVCGGKQLRPVFAVHDHLATGEAFNLAECTDCETRFINPAPDEAEMERYYQSGDYVSHSETHRGVINTIYGFVQPLMLRRKRRLVEHWSGLTGARLLDVGCGSGAFLNTMHQGGWDVTGMDTSATVREAVRRRFGHQVLTTDRFFNLKDNSFEVITLWHVLEHIHQLERYLNHLRALLRPGGTIFIAMPNYDSLDGQSYQSMWAAYDAPRHLYHFTPRSMARLLERFTLKITARLRLPLDSFYVSLLSEKHLQTGGRSFRGWWFGLKSYLNALNTPDKSSSLIYICRTDG